MTKRANSGSAMHALLDLDLGEESSSDSDFRIEDHDGDDGSDFSDDDDNSKSNRSHDEDNTDDDSDDENGDGGNSDSDDDFSLFKDSLNSGKTKKSDKAAKTGDESTTKPNSGEEIVQLSAQEMLKQAKAKEAVDRANAKLLATPICCACLGDRSDDTNEIVECDNCGISVHEGCYGISDSTSISSTVSSCSTEPWFCEACKANVAEPTCELCPNKGGIFKETDVGKWVHLVCALYVSGVAFGEVDHLSSVTLFEMQYSKWGAKSCSLCEDVRFARTGVCIGCDAGMCKTYFHVTCAQAAGLLSEAHSEEADHADPFYAHCKIHSDKTLIKHRKRNYNGLRLKMNHRLVEQEQKIVVVKSTSEQLRIERKLKKHRNKYVVMKTNKQEPWVPTQKMPRLLSTSASACRKLILKAELMGIDTAALEFEEAQMTALADVRKKWHIPPAFSVEFIGYYLDRIARLKDLKTGLNHQMQLNKRLTDDQQRLREQYDQLIQNQTQHSDRNATLTATVKQLHAAIHALCPNKILTIIDKIGVPPTPPHVAVPDEEVPIEPTPPIAAAKLPSVAPSSVARPMSVPTAAALKMGVGFPLTNLPGTHEDPNRILSTQCLNHSSKLMHECGICAQCTDQHMLAKCDTCHLHYHLGCLNPPLSRHPKKSKLYGWQCSECVKSDDSDVAVSLMPTGPRKSRTKYGKDGTIVPVDPLLTDESLVVLNTTSASTESSAESPKAVASNKAAKPTKQKSCEKRPHEEDPLAIPDAENPLDETTCTQSAAKRKKVKKSATAVGDRSNPAASVPTDEEEEFVRTLAAAPSQDCPPVAGQDQDRLDNSSKPNGDASLPITDAKPTKTKANKKTKKEKILANLTNNSTSNKINDHVQTAAVANHPPPTKPSYYIDQNGVLNRLPSSGQPTCELIPPKSIAPLPPATLTTAIDNSVAMTEQDLLLLHKLNRKRRKEKHRNKHHHHHHHHHHNDGELNGAENGNGESLERSSSKKKRKKKSSYQDMENPASTNNAFAADGIPRIKIKFKALSLPGEPAAESHCFYVSAADMVRPADDEYDSSPTTKPQPQPQPPPPPPPPSTSATGKGTAVVNDSFKVSGKKNHHDSAAADNISSPQSTKSLTTKAPKLAKMNGKSSSNNHKQNSIPNKKSNPVKSPVKPISPPSSVTAAVARAPIRHRRLSVFNPKKFSAAVAAAVRKTKNNQKLAAAVVAAAAAASSSSSAAKSKEKPKKSVVVPIVLPAKLTAQVVSAAEPLPAVVTKSIVTRTASPNVVTPSVAAAAAASVATGSAAAAKTIKCDVCSVNGTASDIVRCDECKKNYHFHCLDPPVKKTPKRRGYSWHCADCDPTDNESN